ncbi:MAG TPA: ABC transporter substrate-binding protein [Nocardioidaceae bacterium]|nr:ABC transporter substrate-binding protein [Nocardioidaceae bacterium]
MRALSCGTRRGRRGGLAAGLVMAGALALAGCSSSVDADEGDDSGSFTFTDDRGETVTLDTDEPRIVAQEDAANALMNLGIKPVGIFGGAPMEQNPMLEGLDLDGITSVGEVFGEVKLETLLDLQPDIIVSTYYTGDGVLFPGGVYGFQNKQMQDDAQEIAPILAINATQPSSQVIARFAEMAKAMGADVEGGSVGQSKQEFDHAVDELRSVAKGREELEVLAVTPAEDQMYYAVPDLFPDLLDLEDWGVNIMTPTGDLVSSYYEAVSWENAAKYQPDVVLIDVRGYTLGTDELEKYPTWNAIEAVEAGQIGEWVRVSLSYEDYTKRIERLTDILRNAKDVG